jgi:hypothetical protein
MAVRVPDPPSVRYGTEIDMWMARVVVDGEPIKKMICYATTGEAGYRGSRGTPGEPG